MMNSFFSAPNSANAVFEIYEFHVANSYVISSFFLQILSNKISLSLFLLLHVTLNSLNAV